MRQKSIGAKDPAEQVVRNIRRRTRKQYSAEEKIWIVLEGLRGEETILCWLLGLEPMTRPAITGIGIAGNSVLASNTDNPFFDAHLGSVGDFELNPKQLDRFRDRFSPAGAKDDRRDARTLGDALRTDRHAFRLLDPAAPEIIELREWSRIANDLTGDRTRLVNRAR